MMSYLVTPFFTWLVTGASKFLINSLRERRLAFDLIGYGGMPSNHCAIVSSMTVLIALKEGIDNPAFGVALAFSLIVIFDASSLRNKVAQHAKLLNTLNASLSESEQIKPLRERVGHSKLEIIAGILTGALCAFAVNLAAIL